MKKFTPFVLLLITFGCDTVSNDIDANIKFQRSLQLVASPGKSTVIDLHNMFPAYMKVNLVSKNGVKYFSDRYIKYSADAANTASQFSFDVTTTDNTTTRVNVMTSGAVTDCIDSAPFTQATISNTSSLVVNLLNNPEFCGYDNQSSTEIGIAGSRAGIDVDQNTAGVDIVLCACGAEGNSAILTYVPPRDFVGQVKFKYYLYAGGNVQTTGDAIYYDPQYSQYFSAHEFVIDVTN